MQCSAEVDHLQGLITQHMADVKTLINAIINGVEDIRTLESCKSHWPRLSHGSQWPHSSAASPTMWPAMCFLSPLQQRSRGQKALDCFWLNKFVTPRCQIVKWRLAWLSGLALGFQHKTRLSPFKTDIKNMKFTRIHREASNVLILEARQDIKSRSGHSRLGCSWCLCPDYVFGMRSVLLSLVTLTDITNSRPEKNSLIADPRFLAISESISYSLSMFGTGCVL